VIYNEQHSPCTNCDPIEAVSRSVLRKYQHCCFWMMVHQIKIGRLKVSASFMFPKLPRIEAHRAGAIRSYQKPRKSATECNSPARFQSLHCEDKLAREQLGRTGTGQSIRRPSEAASGKAKGGRSGMSRDKPNEAPSSFDGQLPTDHADMRRPVGQNQSHRGVHSDIGRRYRVDGYWMMQL
jgi:hypothetical protein